MQTTKLRETDLRCLFDMYFESFDGSYETQKPGVTVLKAETCHLQVTHCNLC